ncbi:VOC family protein [Neorhizobium galegae]|uniref:VOC family protein n=1 Tax=Neorhizobium galegae TaxID=399 RepID=UPI0027D85E55|nr:VOC family protein [Neorhizobium galegae]
MAQGRERPTAEFYKNVFGATETNSYEMLRLTMIELQFGSIGIVVCGSDPERESAPSYQGPYHPKNDGAVSTIFQLTVPDVESVVEAAFEFGGMMRDRIQTDMNGRQVASIFDPAGHVWVLIERGQDIELGQDEE